MLAWWHIVRGSEFVSCQPHHDCRLRGKFLQVSRSNGELPMERKQNVKCCKLIIADRYWLAGHFFSCWQLGACNLGCVMPQSVNRDGGKMHTILWYVGLCVSKSKKKKEDGERTKLDGLTDIATGLWKKMFWVVFISKNVFSEFGASYISTKVVNGHLPKPSQLHLLFVDGLSW